MRNSSEYGREVDLLHKKSVQQGCLLLGFLLGPRWRCSDFFCHGGVAAVFSATYEDVSWQKNPMQRAVIIFRENVDKYMNLLCTVWVFCTYAMNANISVKNTGKSNKRAPTYIRPIAGLCPKSWKICLSSLVFPE